MLQQQIEQEGLSKASDFGYDPGSEGYYDLKISYERGASKYAALWQAAEEKVQRYEKALIKIVSLSCKVDSRDAILELKSIASMAVAKEQETLTPKTDKDGR